MILRAALLLVVVVLCGLLYWLEGPEVLHASDVRRPLSSYRLERMPLGASWPPAWVAELRAHLDGSPEVSLLDAAAPEVASELFRQVSWIDPASVRTTLRLPEGLQVEFEPRAAAFLLIRRAVPVGVLAADGVLLPEGLPGTFKAGLLQLELEARATLPRPGQPISSAMALEGLRGWRECRQLEQISGLRVKRIEAARSSPVGGGLPPRLAFRLHDGRLLVWGHAQGSAAAGEPDLELKMARLGAVMRQYPELQGVQEIHLHPESGPVVLDQEFLILPFDGPVYRVGGP